MSDGRRYLASLVLVGVAGVVPMAIAQQASVYEGGDVELTTAENGAVINADLAGHPFMRNQPRLVEVRDRVWSITGYSLANCSFVETDAGIVVFDTGNNVGQGEYFLRQIRTVTDKPVIAIIYSHSHYVNGASALVEDPGTVPLVIGHPDLTAAAPRDVTLAPGRARRANLQFGAYLPLEGNDARATTPEPEFSDPARRRAGFLPVTRAVTDGETLDLGGLSFTFLWTVADTRNSLSVWIPELQTVLTNSVAIMYYPLYTLRGEVHRDPKEIIQGYDRVRALHPEHYVPVHGPPISGASQVDHLLTLHRDAYAFTYNQAVRAINLGWTPDEMVERIELPQRFRDEPSLYEVYSEFPYALRGIYRGLMGWFDEDTTRLNPPSAAVLGKAIVDGFGSRQALLDTARQALAEKRYNLAASLARFAVDAAPDDARARQALADALRMLARVSKSLQSHNFYLTEALHLEGKVDRFEAPSQPVFPPQTTEQLAQLPARQLVTLLESRIDPHASAGVQRTYVVRFADVEETFTVEIRDGVAQTRVAQTRVAQMGVAESREAAPAKVLSATRETWAGLLMSAGDGEPAECAAPRDLCELFSYFR